MNKEEYADKILKSFETGEYEKAIAMLEMLLHHDPDNTTMLLLLDQCYL